MQPQCSNSSDQMKSRSTSLFSQLIDGHFWPVDIQAKRRPRASNGQRYPLPCRTHFGKLKPSWYTRQNIPLLGGPFRSFNRRAFRVLLGLPIKSIKPIKSPWLGIPFRLPKSRYTPLFLHVISLVTTLYFSPSGQRSLTIFTIELHKNRLRTGKKPPRRPYKWSFHQLL